MAWRLQLARAVDARDRIAPTHSLKVARLSRDLALELELDLDAVAASYLGGLLPLVDATAAETENRGAAIVVIGGNEGGSMRGLRFVCAAALALLVGAGAASAHPSPLELKHQLVQGLGLEPGPPGPAPPQSPRASSKNVKVLGHANPGGFNGDVVAHRGHAYLGSWGNFTGTPDFCPAQGVRVYSLFDLASPTLVATFADGASNTALAGSWTEKVIVRHVSTPWFNGELAAVSFQDCEEGGFRGVGLYDVTDPSRPVELDLFETGFAGVHELWLQPRGNRVFVYTAAVFEEVSQFFGGVLDGSPDFRVIDVSDPRHPVKVGEWGAWKELGIDPFPGLGSFPFNFVHSVIGNESGSRAYLSYWDNGTVILDMSDPASPEYVGRTPYPAGSEGNAHSAWLARGENVLVQADEDFDSGPFPGIETSWGYTRIFDISDPAAPAQIGTFKMPQTTQFPPPLGDYSVHDPKVHGSTLYLSYYSNGVVVADIARPEQPRFVAQFLPEPAADPFGFFAPPDVKFPFVWGVYPERNYVLASDINSGLWVFQVR